MIKKPKNKFKQSVESNSGLLRFWLSSVCDYSTIFTPSFQTIRFKTWSPAFSRASASLFVLTSRSHWNLMIMSHLLIGYRDHFVFVFVFTALIRNVKKPRKNQENEIFNWGGGSNRGCNGGIRWYTTNPHSHKRLQIV